jgi:hypothetical protein
MLIYWSEEAACHIRTRSSRYPGAVDIEPAWTTEAMDDPEALWFEPDPKSDSGLGIRIIGYSVSARLVVTVIAYREARRLRGATAWKAGGSDLRAYRKGVS